MFPLSAAERAALDPAVAEAIAAALLKEQFERDCELLQAVRLKRAA